MDRELTLVEHLGELRKRIIVSLIALGIASVFSFPFASAFLRILRLPASGLIEKLVFFSPQDALMVHMQLAFLCGLIISIPVILYQFWAFVSPAIEERLKRRIVYFVIFCTLAFITGILFAYFMLIPPALRFLLSFAGDNLEPVISAQKYISFLTSIILGSALVFQMPVLSFILTKLRIINARLLRKKYKYAVVLVFITAAAITPTTDAFNMLIMAAPMMFLYEVSIWISFFARIKIKAA